ncbi:MAG TPA: phospholipase D family protein [Ktedonobacterales bacterium]
MLHSPIQTIDRLRAVRQPGAQSTWWARGDAPVRVADAVVPLIDGRAGMLAMCVAFLSAKRTIWLADWDLHARLLMVRDRDQRAGPDGSPEQERLLASLRAAGLDDAAIALWTSGRLRVMDVLGFAAQRGVDVRVLIWSPFNPFGLFHITNDTGIQQRLLQVRGVACRQDKSSRSPFHMAQALHQKCAVIDDRIAFAGGIDLTVQYNGDFDRWDMPAHPFDGRVRGTELGPAPHPWHDAHLLLVGEPAQDIRHNIEQRWHEADGASRLLGILWPSSRPPLRYLARRLRSGEAQQNIPALSKALPGNLSPEKMREAMDTPLPGPAALVQVVRTIPPLTYRFAPEGIVGIAQAYIEALRSARHFIYLESQYLWLEGFNGIDMWRLGWRSLYMKTLLHALAEAAERGVTIALVLPDHPNCGRPYTDDTLAWLRDHAPKATQAGRIHALTLATSSEDSASQTTRYRPIYVHAKVGIVDDQWATIGSANLNSRGMSHDAELNVAVLDSAFARGLRLSLWGEHLGLLRDAHTGWPAPASLPLQHPQPMPELADLLSILRQTEYDKPAPVGDGPPALSAPHTLPDEHSTLLDPGAGIELLAQRARENLDHLRNGRPLKGQIFPYLTCPDAEALGLAIDANCGLLDPLRAISEHIAIRHANKYS